MKATLSEQVEVLLSIFHAELIVNFVKVFDLLKSRPNFEIKMATMCHRAYNYMSLNLFGRRMCNANRNKLRESTTLLRQ